MVLVWGLRHDGGTVEPLPLGSFVRQALCTRTTDPHQELEAPMEPHLHHDRALRDRLVGSTICYPTSVDSSFTLERALEGIHHIGLEKVEIFSIRGYCEHVSLADVGPQAADDLRRLLARYGAVATVLNFATNLDTDEGVHDFRQAAELAERLDVKLLVANVESASDAESERAFFERVPSIIEAADEHDVVLALETHGGLVSTLADGADLVARIGSDRIKIAYDMANVVKYGGVLPEQDLRVNVTAAKDAIAYVHLKDKADLSDRYDYPPFGDGILDFVQVKDLLDSVGYEGLFALEVELDGKPASAEIVDEALDRSLSYLQRVWHVSEVRT
jgi:sugar phosphate isomerase/epimerase